MTGSQLRRDLTIWGMCGLPQPGPWHPVSARGTAYRAVRYRRVVVGPSGQARANNTMRALQESLIMTTGLAAFVQGIFDAQPFSRFLGAELAYVGRD
jgi:hypothetical protein